MPAVPASAAGLDQLQHLGTNATGTTFTIECLEDQLGRVRHIAGFSGIGGLVEQLGGLIEQLLARQRIHNGQRRPAAWNRLRRPQSGAGDSHASEGMTLGGWSAEAGQQRQTQHPNSAWIRSVRENVPGGTLRGTVRVPQGWN